jgi:hypothetical protein
LIEFSIALHKYSMYPDGHPSLRPAAGAVVIRAEELLSDRIQIAFGIARRQLVIEGVATNPAQPVLRRLAEWLNRHQLGAVTVRRGLEIVELSEALRALAQDPEQVGPLGLAPPETRSAWSHLRLHPLSFGGLSLIDEEPPTPDEANRHRNTRSADLWVGLAGAALANDRGVDPDEPVPTEPVLIAQAIDEHPEAEAYDQVIIGYLLQIAQELRDSPTAETRALKRRTARLIASLKPETLRRLIEMGGNAEQRHQFVLDATQGMAVEAVIDLVKVAGETSGQTISHGLLRLLSKLAVHAEFGEPEARPAADGALREQVGRLLGKWRLEDPIPADYRDALQHLATRPASDQEVQPGDPHLPDALRLIQLCLECDEAGPFIERAIDRAVADGQLHELLALIADEDTTPSPVRERLLSSLRRPESVRLLLQQSPVDFDTVARLQPFMTDEHYHVLFDALASANDRTTRRKLLDCLVQAPIDLGPLIVARLGDERWFIERNLLVLLERRGPLPEGFSPAPWTRHPDVRVRREAIRLQLRVPNERTRAIRAALEDHHPGLVHSGLAALQQEGPDELLDLVAAVVVDETASDALRVLAVRSLGRCDDPRALAVLTRLTDGGRTLLGRQRLNRRSPVAIAAVEALAARWSDDHRAAGLLRVAAKSPDPQLRRAARGEAR